MRKNPITLYSSLLPLVVIVGLILGTGYLLIGDELKLPKIFSGEPKIHRLEGFPTNLSVEDNRDKIRTIITNEEELNEFLNTVDESGLLTLKEKVNFSRKYLVGVATKTLEEDDHDFKVRKAYKNKEQNKILISLVREDPGETCEVEQNKNIWIDLVEIDKTDWEIDFELIKKIIECEIESEDGN